MKKNNKKNLNPFLFSILTIGFIFSSIGLSFGRIAVIVSEKNEIHEQVTAGFLDTIKRYQRDIPIQIFYLEGNDSHEDIKKNILKFYPHVNFAVGSPAAKFCSNLTFFPFVYTLVFRPEKLGYCDEKKRPIVRGTGVLTTLHPEVQMTQLRKTLPNAKRIGLLYSSKTKSIYQELKSIAKNYKFQLISTKVETLNDVPKKFRNLSKKNIDVFWLFPDNKILSRDTITYLIKNCQSRKINLFSFNSNHIKLGASLVSTIDYSGLGKQCSEIAWSVIKGADVNAINVERTRFSATATNSEYLFQKSR